MSRVSITSPVPSSISLVIALSSFAVLSSAQQLHLRGFSGSLFDRIVNNFAPTLGVDPKVLGVTNNANTQQSQPQHGTNFGVNPMPSSFSSLLGSNNFQQLSNRNALFGNLLSRYQSELNPDVKAQFRSEIERLLSETSQTPANNGNVDPAQRLQPYVNFLNVAANNPALTETLRQYLAQQAALTTTTTTTTTPSPAQAIFQQAARYPGLLQHLIRLAQGQQPGGQLLTTPFPTTTTTTTTTTTPAPPVPTAPSPSPLHIIQQLLAAVRATASPTMAPTTLSPSTTTTTTTAAPSTTARTVSQLGNLGFSVDQVIKDPAVYQEFLQFLQFRRGLTASVADNLIPRVTPTEPATAVTATTTTPATTQPLPIEKFSQLTKAQDSDQTTKLILKQVLDKVMALINKDGVSSTPAPDVLSQTLQSTFTVTTATPVPEMSSTSAPNLNEVMEVKPSIGENRPLEVVSPDPTSALPSITTTDPEFMFNQLLALSGIAAADKEGLLASMNSLTALGPANPPESPKVEEVQTTRATPSPTSPPPRVDLAGNKQDVAPSSGKFWNHEFAQLTRMQQKTQNDQLLKQFEAQRQLVEDSTRTSEPGNAHGFFVSTNPSDQGHRNFHSGPGNFPSANVVMDTPEVAAAKEAHFREVAKVKAEKVEHVRKQALKELIQATLNQHKQKIN